jgi:hypothetical protein
MTFYSADQEEKLNDDHLLPAGDFVFLISTDMIYFPFFRITLSLLPFVRDELFNQQNVN